ncbi:MAG: preprotein translocase subunit SecA [Deltaproteobacteria bacterium]|uniref:Protein translocase subunit SecA n=1 Tax=Candidatus Zymogenus saltonus TaxID=2844893 RepID=A0A9D8KCK2_9DELT|nr:preprotein translocase subunit SecA [Candidatus Zymogenus saltonus]
MFGAVLKKIIGSKNEREIRRMLPIVEAINALEPEMMKLSDMDLRAKTEEFKKRLGEGWELDDLIEESFAVVREASRRTIGLRHFDVQLIGGIVLHEGKIAEMKTGEGKTLVATLPAYLNGLTGRGVYIVTVNDYLAKRDREWMGRIFEFLGLTVGVILHDMSDEERKAAYACDIVYGTNNEYGFDYLRDNMKFNLENYVQREPFFAIVDEVDSILIDEARTPLIISSQVDRDSHQYDTLKPLIKRLVTRQKEHVNNLFVKAVELEKGGDFEGSMINLIRVERGDPKNRRLLKLLADRKEIKKEMTRMEGYIARDKRTQELEEGLLYMFSEKEHNVSFTEEGQGIIRTSLGDLFDFGDINEEYIKIEQDESLSTAEKENKKKAVGMEFEDKTEKIHNLSQLLKAYTLFENDVDYVVNNGEVIIVDQFTGRMMPGRRYSDGLHQALEAKEDVTIAKATRTVATVTLQNYFRMFEKLAGMTGTADTEAEEFNKVYKLDVMVIPTNRPLRRDEYSDLIYKTENGKFLAVADEIAELNREGRPVLVGTTSIEKSEKLSRLLKMRKIPHLVLNAKHHEREAEIVSGAGQYGAVTIATNMAGRGTDIVLGDEVPELGGLHIIGTERHESRRIDNQLRGRSGRQGDKGSSQFYLSLEDDLLRIFGADRIMSVMNRLGMEEGEAIEHSLLTKAIENAQRKVEGNNFSIRKNLLEYDDVMNKQREVIYERRREILGKDDLRDDIMEMIEEKVEEIMYLYTSDKGFIEDWDAIGIAESIMTYFSMPINLEDPQISEMNNDDFADWLLDSVTKRYMAKEEHLTPPLMRHLEKMLMLETLDSNWRDHLEAMDQLKEGIGLRAYGQRNPLIEYQKEGFNLFSEMGENVKGELLGKIFRVQIAREEEVRPRLAIDNLNLVHRDFTGAMAAAASQAEAGEAMQTNRGEDSAPQKPKTVVRESAKIGRNDPCPCGSGKKYKKCCGKVAEAS